MNRFWSDRRAATKMSNFIRTLQNRPLSSLVVACIAVSFYLVGLLHGRTSKTHISFANLYSSSGSEVCPPCDIPEGLKALIPPLPSKYEDLLKSTAMRWLTPWDKYDFESMSISTKMVDNLWEYMYDHGHSHSSFRVRVVNGSLIWPPTLMQAALQHNMYYMPRINHWHNLFTALEEAHGLPDYLDMVISTQDHPKLLRTPFNMDKAPLFVYTTTPDFAEIPLPTTEYFGKIKQLLPTELEAAQKWDGRTAKAIWRGSPTGGEYTKQNFWRYPRTHLVNHTRAHSDILDAKFLPCAPGQCSAETFEAMKEAGLPTDTKQFSFGEYTGFKYLVDIDGNAWSSRYAHVLACGAVFFKADSPYTEYFYDFLTPYKDYIPIAQDASDLPEKLRYAVAHDEEMRLIHQRVLEKHAKLIGNGNWLKYVHFVLSEYSSLLERPPNLPTKDVIRFTGSR
eukprot:TRINITY_DN18407_c0_g1_i1.p1 TRINITY_DN18407_c0_g1~~TRINITY_DN18407_c0_g1_i1.p1  ORF type:complete len:451 (+),score=49.90 TRINITY_DN18407_c0_g1_i1:200-1552(+)